MLRPPQLARCTASNSGVALVELGEVAVGQVQPLPLGPLRAIAMCRMAILLPTPRLPGVQEQPHPVLLVERSPR